MISLVPVTDQHRDQMLVWRNEPDVARWMYTDHRITSDEHAAWFDRILASPDHRYWIVTWESTPAGVVYLIGRPDGHRAEWGIYLVGARGTGAAAGAAFLSLDHGFGELGVRRVTCEALAGNERALSLYERLGFRREGYLRAHVARRDGALDVVCLGLLAEEWSILRPGLHARLVNRGVLPAGG